MDLTKVMQDVAELQSCLEVGGRPQSAVSARQVLALLCESAVIELAAYDRIGGPSEGMIGLPQLPALVVHPEQDYLTLVVRGTPERLHAARQHGYLKHAAFDDALQLIAMQLTSEGHWQVSPFSMAVARQLVGGVNTEMLPLMPEVVQEVMQSTGYTESMVRGAVFQDMAVHLAAVMTAGYQSPERPAYLH